MINETREQRISRIEKIYAKKKAEEYETRKQLFLNNDLSSIDEIPFNCIKELRNNLIKELSEETLNKIDIILGKKEQVIKQKQLEFKRNKKKEEYPLKEAYRKYGASGAYALMMSGLR